MTAHVGEVLDPYSAAMNPLSHMKEFSQIKRKEVTSKKRKTDREHLTACGRVDISCRSKRGRGGKDVNV